MKGAVLFEVPESISLHVLDMKIICRDGPDVSEIMSCQVDFDLMMYSGD